MAEDIARDSSIYGIYNSDNVTPALLAESCISVEISKEFRIPDYYVENGAFVSYDKVERPGEYRVRMAQGENVASRISFLDALDIIVRSMNLYHVVTPEKIYINVNVVRYTYKRTAQNGVSLIQADITLEEVMIVNAVSVAAADPNNTATQAGAGTPPGANHKPIVASQVKAPSSADAINSGSNQTTPATATQVQQIKNSPDLQDQIDRLENPGFF